MTLSSLNDATKIDMATWSVGMRPKLIRSTACNVRRPAVHESLALACKLDPSQRGNGPPTRLEIKWPSAAIALWFREIALWFNAGLSVVKPDVLSSPQGLQWVKKQTCASAHEHLRLDLRRTFGAIPANLHVALDEATVHTHLLGKTGTWRASHATSVPWPRNLPPIASAAPPTLLGGGSGVSVGRRFTRL